MSHGLVRYGARLRIVYRLYYVFYVCDLLIVECQYLHVVQ